MPVFILLAFPHNEQAFSQALQLQELLGSLVNETDRMFYWKIQEFSNLILV